MPNRLKEEIKQIRIVKEDVYDPEATKELEHALRPLKNAVEILEDDS